MKKLLLTVAILVALVATPFAGTSSEKVSVGDFALKISRALGWEVSDRAGAVAALTSAGASLGKNLDDQLTERMAADILGSLGVKVTTSNPSVAVSPAKADALATGLALSDVSKPEFDCTGPPPDACREIVNKNGMINQGKCKQCCKDAIQSSNPHDHGCRGGQVEKVCKTFCKTGEFPSPSEPQL